MPDCLFCKIAAKEIPSECVYEDEHTFAFLDIVPNNHGHTLVVPKKHSRNILDIDEDTLSLLVGTVRKISHAVKTAMNADGLNITMNNEPTAGQVVFHSHIHVIPRFESDGLKVWHKKVPYKDESEMRTVGGKIRDALIS